MLYSTIRRELFRSLHKKYKSDIQTSKSTLLIYFNNPVGIGEHPQHLEEMNTLLENMTSAHDKLEILHRYFKDGNLKDGNLKQISLPENTEIKNNNYPIRTDDLD